MKKGSLLIWELLFLGKVSMSYKTVYKIQRISDGLFSTGGYQPRFTKKGKIWTTKAALHNHLALNPRNGFQGIEAYVDCELIEYEIVEWNRIPMLEYAAERQRTADEKEALREREEEARTALRMSITERIIGTLTEVERKELQLESVKMRGIRTPLSQRVYEQVEKEFNQAVKSLKIK